MKNQEKRPCPLCERHQRMETTSGMLFWVEWGEDGNPRLYAPIPCTTAAG